MADKQAKTEKTTVELLCSRVVQSDSGFISQARGDKVEMERDEADRHIAAGYAKPA